MYQPGKKRTFLSLMIENQGSEISLKIVKIAIFKFLS
jgi:hypothetical protein